MQTPTYARELRLKQLAACLSAALAIGTMEPSAQARSLPQGGLLGASHHVGAKARLSPVPSAIRNVISCADDGSAGTLRQVISGSVDGDYIDLSGLSCSTITLVSGEISTTLNGLTLHGPTDRTLTITTSASNRLLHHIGIGDLTIDHLTLSNGKYSSSTGDAIGGCVNSSGGVNLYSSVVTGCTVSVLTTHSFPTYALGGAVYGHNFVEVSYSQITGSMALAFDGNRALGGGLFTRGLYGDHSTLNANSAIGTGTSVASGGAAAVRASVYLVSSTIDANQANVVGGLYQVGASSDSVTIRNSTISGNTATALIAAIYVTSPLRLDNSTVAFNSGNSDPAIETRASVVANSSIIAKNSTNMGGFADLYVGGAGSTLTGSHNLIVSANLGLPDTLTSNPRLVPLANHGGPTRTHALVPLSPAVDVGNNTFPLTYDQRGTGFSREVGAAADIGAYERQVNDDEIFYDGVE